ncbi:MAG: SDR family NAD(P)-dependent oxidoreductase [Pseudoflavonifractor sp.]|nr:SDR family NAD(P)-dependent oxidoreductase [Pseudoflavonifractor sp.]
MKRIVIMGASSGIGLTLAEILASRGVPVGIAARNLQPLLELRGRYPGNVVVKSIDITSPDAPVRMLQLIDALGGMDIYIHVAGIGYENLTLDPDREAAIVDTNATGFARMIDTAYRYMRGNGIRGQIAAVTSVAGTNGIGRLAAYSASKRFGQAYLTALQQLAHAERSGIRFTDIRPGWTDTPLLLPGVSYPMEMEVRPVAVEIIRAIARKRRVAVIDRRWNVVVGLWRLIPNALWVRLNIPISRPDLPMPTPGD